MTNESDNKSNQQPIYKKWWFWLIVIIALMVIYAVSPKQDENHSGELGNIAASVSSNSDENAQAEVDDELSKLHLNPQPVRNDVTGKWYISSIAEPVNISTMALDYYNRYMKEDEIHFIVNFSYNTTTQISKNAGGLNVVVREHVDGEEHDAKKLGEGKLLTEKYYDSKTGEEIKYGN